MECGSRSPHFPCLRLDFWVPVIRGFFSSSQCDEGRKRFATVATILLHTMLQKLLSLCTTKSDAHDDDDATLRVSRA